jgi:hypothetical protein
VLFYKLLNQLSSTKVDEWDAQVRVMYPKGSSEFVTIFPQGHKPFQQGSYDSRIRAVSALDGALTTIGTLPVTQADVHGFYNSINGARITQESEKGGTNGDSRSLVIAITKAMNGMFTFLNSALAHFSNDTESVEVMFDLQTIRQHEQTFFTGHVKPLQVRVVCKRTFHQSIMVEIENMSSLPLVVYSSLVKGAMPDGISVTVSAYQTMLVNLTDLGPLTNHYLQAYNANAFQEAEYHINLDPDAMEQAA